MRGRIRRKRIRRRISRRRKRKRKKEDKEDTATVPNISTTKYPNEVNHG